MLTPRRTTTLTVHDIATDQQIPGLEVAVTPTLIVGGAIASRDFHPSHHDHHRARELGAPDIFMNILTTNGLVERWITDWTGPETIVRSVKIRLGTPNYPGDTMRFSGRVSRVDTDAEPDRGVVDIEFAGSNERGDHVIGTAQLTLPRSG